MTSTVKSLVVRSLLMAGFVLGAVQGCGSSSSSSGNYAQTCMQGCAKTVPCEADAGIPITMSECVMACTMSAMTSSGGTCTNAAAMQSAAQACLSKTTCTDLLACGLTIPPCEGGAGGANGAAGKGGGAGTSGSAGKAGGAGTSGSAGKSGGAGASGAGGAGAIPMDCTACSKATTCCATNNFSAALCAAIPTASACNSATGQTQTTDIGTCMAALSYAATMGISCP
jgi:hypothetical protein